MILLSVYFCMMEFLNHLHLKESALIIRLFEQAGQGAGLFRTQTVQFLSDSCKKNCRL